ncbi:CTP synthase [Mycoplasma marinum]|uniref:CTP synthase n=1 Tax=Mycoplasma marinum TaxID=1937190 RepID=UPI003B2BEAE6
MAKYIFVTGGVLSGLGKGVSAASVGRLLKARGYKVFVQKFDPYLNVDPGTMSPYEHGEVYVTADGAETDLDLGHYERFIDEKFSKHSNYTTAQIFKRLMDKERNGDFNGKTVQIVPHMTDEIEHLIKLGGRTSKADIVITEIGGTVGDIESQSFFRALAGMLLKEPKNCFFIHTTYIPFLTASKEFKTKPAQFSMSELWSLSIKPNMVFMRSTNEVTAEVHEKVSRTSFIPKDRVISVPDAENIYTIPLELEKQKVAQKILKHFGMSLKRPKLDDWKEYVSKIQKSKKHETEIAMIGKYIELEDAYMSIIEALKISANYTGTKLKLRWIQADNLTEKNIKEAISGTNGAIILPGFGKRGFNGKVIAAKYLRDIDHPTFGICFGMQAMTVEQAHRMGIKDATSSEVSETGTFVFDFIRGKKKTDGIGGTLRLGESKTLLKKDSIASKIYESDHAIERHRHRYEVNPEFLEQVEGLGFQFSGFDEKTNLAEVCEVKGKKFYFGVQYHPEFTARPLRDNPIFTKFLKAAIKNKK